ncbi:dihydrolipoamide acetyltransferase family protein [Ferruginibacter sp. HRS2-29]|uniref:dihydrolipoamide acetyltransferase family protein n=1 Tax=Ferruginibacter sp. HRS2-29 TaxID=2487334 RepID=UPI0020CDA1B5|nr:dihydrolipoamide acetyltransferase family protein [Ferruginibacter sp. HRS2-29]MCP9751403.1 2-oxo acid dehydrogenase subunit E2 [Ferruginibacter sp. HRS2-29]
MSLVDLVMPKLGESIMEATILKWHKNPGDKIAQDETVLDIATDKVDSEVPSTAEGVIEEILFKENDVVPIGTVIAKIRVGANQSAATIPSTPSAPAAEEYEEARLVEDIPFVPSNTIPAPSSNSSNAPRFYSPLVLNIAQSEGISMSELENIPGTGQDGRVSKKDILAFVANRGKAPVQQQQQSQQVTVLPADNKQQSAEQPKSAAASLPTVYQGNVEIIEMDRMRKLIAKHMVDSKHTSPHVTSFAECDVTNLVLWRDRVKKDFEKREGEKITFTPLFIEAIVKCIKKYPWLSSSVDGDRIIVKKDIGIGMATALPTGNLIVPVIKNADQLNLVGLTKQVNGLANAARTGKLKPDDTIGGTFTLTNVGTFGSIMGTPIINQPQVAIMAVGAIKKRPMVIETAQGDTIGIRHMMYISLSYDHRIIDGALGSTFLNAVSKELENFDSNRQI